MKRREFIALLGGAAAMPLPLWPLAARGQQQGDRVPRVGVLMAYAVTDAEAQSRIAAFRKELRKLGWVEGRNVQIDYRWAAGDEDSIRAYARELVALRPNVIVARSSPEVAALQKETNTIPVVFAHATDPVASGFVPNLAHPGGNITGFTTFEYPMGGKWLEMLREVAPGTRRVSVVHNPDNVSSPGYLRVMDGVAQTLGLQLMPAAVHNAADIERAIDAFAREPKGAMVVLPDFVTTGNREAIVTLAAADRHRLPTVYPFSYFVRRGGLMSYAAELLDLYRRSASYVDRILRGERVGDLPVQAPTKYELVINLKTAKSLGLDLPPSVLARADEVIE